MKLHFFCRTVLLFLEMQALKLLLKHLIIKALLDRALFLSQSLHAASVFKLTYEESETEFNDLEMWVI